MNTQPRNLAPNFHSSKFGRENEDLSLIRSVPLSDLMRGLGAVFRSSVPSRDDFQRSSPHDLRRGEDGKVAHKIDYFFSHTWCMHWVTKFISLSIYFGAGLLIKVGIAVGVVSPLSIMLYHLIVCRDNFSSCELQVPTFTCRIVLVLALMVTISFSCHRRRNTRCFLDKLCIRQCRHHVSDDKFFSTCGDCTDKIRGITNLGSSVKYSKQFVVVLTSEYFLRLWCVYELASAVAHGEKSKRNIIFVDPYRAKYLVQFWISVLLTSICFLNETVNPSHPLNMNQPSIDLFYYVLIDKPDPSAYLTPGMREFLSCHLFEAFGVSAVACWLYGVYRERHNQHHRIYANLGTFSIERDTTCSFENDRKLIYKGIREWFSKPTDSNYESASSGEDDEVTVAKLNGESLAVDKPLRRFERYIRTDFRKMLRSCHTRITYLEVMSLPGLLSGSDAAVSAFHLWLTGKVSGNVLHIVSLAFLDGAHIGFTIGAIATIIPVVLINRTPEFKNNLLENCFLVICGLLTGFTIQAQLAVMRILNYVSIGYQHFSNPSMAFYAPYLAAAAWVAVTTALMKTRRIVESPDFEEGKDARASWIRDKLEFLFYKHENAPAIMKQSSSESCESMMGTRFITSEDIRNPIDFSTSLNFARKVKSGGVSEVEFLRAIYKIYPELGYYSCKDVSASPEVSARGGDMWRMERNRTVGAMLCAYWIYTDDYEAFTRSQQVDSALSRKSWGAIREWLRESNLLETEACSATMSLISFHDVCKIRDFRDKYGGGLSNHDTSLGIVIDTNHRKLPSFCALPDKYRVAIRDFQSTDFNFCQFVQGESIPANLTSAKEFIEKHGMDAFNFYIFHCFLDVAGALGHVSLDGSLTMNENLYRSFTDARLAVTGSYDSEWEASAYRAYMSSRAKRIGLLVDDSDFAAAVARLCCMSRCSTPRDAERVVSAMDGLGDLVGGELVRFLSATGLPTAGQQSTPAVQIMYAPSILVESAKNERVGLEGGMRILLEIYRKVQIASTVNEENLQNAEVVANEVTQFVKSYQGSSRAPFEYVETHFDCIREFCNAETFTKFSMKLHH